MTTDNKSLADVQPGGRVKLGDGRQWLEIRGLASAIVKNLEAFAASPHKAAWCGALDDSLMFADQIEKDSAAAYKAALASRQPVGEPFAYGSSAGHKPIPASIYYPDNAACRELYDIPLCAAPPAQVVEMSPEFTDTARAAIAWVLWHHQGGSSPVGQPLRFALGMGQHDRITDQQISEAKRFAVWAGVTSEGFHHRSPVQDVHLGKFRELASEMNRFRMNFETVSIAEFNHYADRLLALIDSQAVGNK